MQAESAAAPFQSRGLSMADAAAVAQLWIAGAHESALVDPAFRPRVSVAEYAASLAQELGSGATVGWGSFAADGTLLGYLTARVTEASPEFVPAKYLYLLDLDVHSGARRRGIGSRLVRIAREYAARNELTSIEVSWLLSDAQATAFWRAQGFTRYLARARSTV